MKSNHYLRKCPLCRADVSKNNIPPFLGGIECPKCHTIFQFPTSFDERIIRMCFNRRPTDRSVLVNFAIAATTVVTSMIWIFELFFDDVMMIALR